MKLTLTPAQRSALLTINNPADQTLSIQITAFRWSLDEKGETRIDSTEEIVLFPSLIEITPHSERNVRVGALVDFGNIEKDYRLLIEELRPPAKQSGIGIQLLTKVSMPVFQAPRKEVKALKITNAALASGQLAFRVDNQGNVHASPHKLHLSGQDATGAEIFLREIDNWYLLPGTSRPFTVEIPAEICPQLKTIEIQGEADGTPFSQRVQMGADACAR